MRRFWWGLVLGILIGLIVSETEIGQSIIGMLREAYESITGAVEDVDLDVDGDTEPPAN